MIKRIIAIITPVNRPPKPKDACMCAYEDYNWINNELIITV